MRKQRSEVTPMLMVLHFENVLGTLLRQHVVKPWNQKAVAPVDC